MTIQEALNFVNVYSELSSSKIPFKLAFKLHKINKEAQLAVDFYREKLEGIIEEYGERDGEGKIKTTESGNISLKQETVEECREKIDELLNVEWDTEDFSFTDEEIKTFESFDLTPTQWESFFSFF